MNNFLGDKPPPGSYDPDYYDIAKRAQIKESYFSSAKKVPFSTSETRFKELKKENNSKFRLINKMFTCYYRDSTA